MNLCQTFKATSEDSKCPRCKNTGFEKSVDENGYEFYRECGCGIRIKQIASRRLEFANIPTAFKDNSFSGFNVNCYKTIDSRNYVFSAMKKINYWLKNLEDMQSKGIGLYLYSKTKGSGKTKMITSIANELIGEEYKRQVKFATSLQILNEIKNTWQNNTETQLIMDLVNTEILIIDDFGTEQVKDWIGEKFYSIINERYIAKKITLFTSNYAIDELVYDDRITNRIKEMCYEIHFAEESIREQIHANNEDDLAKMISKKVEK